MLLAQVGKTGNEVKLATFAIDYKTYESALINVITVAEFKSAMRTKTHIVLYRTFDAEAINAFDLEQKQIIEGAVMETSSNNDFVFT